jgi:hypothetical protein
VVLLLLGVAVADQRYSFNMHERLRIVRTCVVCGALVLHEYDGTHEQRCRDHCVSEVPQVLLDHAHVPGNNNNNMYPVGLRYVPLSVDAGPPPRNNNNNWYPVESSANNNANCDGLFSALKDANRDGLASWLHSRKLVCDPISKERAAPSPMSEANNDVQNA